VFDDEPEPDQTYDNWDPGGAGFVKLNPSRFCWPDLFWWLR
jgi:hypothetical protein